MTASSLRRSPFGLRRSARDPWRLPGTRRVRSRAGRASRSLPRVSPDATLARAHPHVAAFGGSAASAATRPNDNNNDNDHADDNDPSNNDNSQIRLGWRHVPPRRASAPGYRRGDLADSPRYRTPRIATGSQRRRSFAAIQRRAPRQLTPRPRRPVARNTGLGVAAGARLASLCPALYGRRRAFRRGITPEGLPHDILTAQACCGVGVAGPPPISKPQCGSPNGCHAHCHGLTLAARAAHAIPAPAPACHTALRADTQERPCGRPCRRRD